MKRAALLLEHSSSSEVSRWEKGKKDPSLQNAFLLSVLYQQPLETLFPNHAAYATERIKKRAEHLGLEQWSSSEHEKNEKKS